MKDVIHQLADAILQEWIDNDESAYKDYNDALKACLLYTSPSPRDRTRSRMPSSA